MIRTLLVDDQALIRVGLRTILEVESDLEVVGEAGDGARAVAFVDESPTDVVLMDVRMPVLNGIEATRTIRARHPETHVVMLTTFQDEEYLLEAMRAGASGFLLKDSGAALIASAAREAARGDVLLDPAMTRALVEHRLRDAPQHILHATLAPTVAALSERERDVLDELATGRSNAAIAERLFVSEGTVKTHVSNILAKTGSTSRLGAVVFAFESGFVAQRRATRPPG